MISMVFFVYREIHPIPDATTTVEHMPAVKTRTSSGTKKELIIL